MEYLQSFKLGLWNAWKVTFPVCCNSRCQLGRHFSTLGGPSLREYGSPNSVSSKEVIGSKNDDKDPSQSGLTRPAIRKRHKAYAFQNKFLRGQELEAPNTPPCKKEFRSLRDEDFSKEKRRSQPLTIERIKGSEILFGIAPCSLALARAKRNFFRLFLKSGSSSPAIEDFSRQAKDWGIPVRFVHRKVLDALCKGGVHQGVCLETTSLRPIAWQEEPSSETQGATAHEGSQLLWLGLEGIQDPMNLGAVLRSAHFLGVDRILMSQRNR